MAHLVFTQNNVINIFWNYSPRSYISFYWFHSVSIGRAFGNRNAVLLLLDLYQKHSSDMRNKMVKKHKVWMKIAEAMNKKGYQLSYAMCEKKWRNLKSTYTKLRDPVTGRSRSSWEFYERMDDLCRGSNVTTLQDEQNRYSTDDFSFSNRNTDFCFANSQLRENIYLCDCYVVVVFLECNCANKYFYCNKVKSLFWRILSNIFIVIIWNHYFDVFCPNFFVTIWNHNFDISC